MREAGAIALLVVVALGVALAVVAIALGVALSVVTLSLASGWFGAAATLGVAGWLIRRRAVNDRKGAL